MDTGRPARLTAWNQLALTTSGSFHSVVYRGKLCVRDMVQSGSTIGWALLVAFPLALLAAGVSYRAARHRTADLRKYQSEVDLPRAELELVKRQIPSAS